MKTEANQMRLLASSVFALSVFAQAPSKPSLPQPQTRNTTCADPKFRKPCESFRQLVYANDKDILRTISKLTSYVCFRPDEEDTFVVFQFDPPPRSGWSKSDALHETAYGSSELSEYRDGLWSKGWIGEGLWHRYVHNPLLFFQSIPATPSLAELGVRLDDTVATISRTFERQEDGSVFSEIEIRRSTGRFVETLLSANGVTRKISGTCLIYP